MLHLDKDVLMKILSYTGEYYESDEDMQHPFRRDVLQLYCVSKSFSWLTSMWIMGYIQAECDDYCVTCDIFGKEFGPTYYFYNELSGYRYHLDDLLVGPHFYTIMPNQNLCKLGFLIVNGRVYRISHRALEEIKDYILKQWKNKDKMSYDWCSGKLSGNSSTNILIRKKIDNYPTYIFEVPQNLILEKESRQIAWGPKWIQSL